MVRRSARLRAALLGCAWLMGATAVLPAQPAALLLMRKVRAWMGHPHPNSYRTRIQPAMTGAGAPSIGVSSRWVGSLHLDPAQPAGAAPGESQLRAALIRTLEQQDVEGAMALYEPDAVFLSPGGRYGDRAAIRTLYRSVLMAVRSKITMTSKRVVIGGSLCVDDGAYSETLTELATGKRTVVTGDYVLVARRGQNGSGQNGSGPDGSGQNGSGPDGSGQNGSGPDGSWKVAEIVWTQTSSTPL